MDPVDLFQSIDASGLFLPTLLCFVAVFCMARIPTVGIFLYFPLCRMALLVAHYIRPNP